MSKRLRAFRQALVVTALLALAVAPVMAEPLAAGVLWKDPSFVDLDVKFPGDGYQASWKLYRCDCGDLMIQSELSVPGEVVRGDILLVDNRAILLRGFDPDSAELVSIDAPALMMQLALRLLERAQPAGPAAVTERQDVLIEDKINLIHLQSGAAVGGFPAPWTVKGSVWPQGDTERRFELLFSFTASGTEGAGDTISEIHFKGLAEYAPGVFPLTGDLSLDDWELSWREDNEAIAAKAKGVETLGALRQLLKSD
jgi:hypothetical protein